jgi:hypothetical protein
VGFKLAWIPAFAGMTDEKPSRYMSLNLCADVYHVLARYVPRGQLDSEVGQVLDGIVDVASHAKPVAGDS